jgi:hypothetical protein
MPAFKAQGMSPCRDRLALEPLSAVAVKSTDMSLHKIDVHGHDNILVVDGMPESAMFQEECIVLVRGTRASETQPINGFDWGR